jgi:4-hydroxybenzoate polyprenyltransferase
MIREYLKLARSYNAVLTGISPVMGAISMGQFNLDLLLLLFLVGFLGHTYGFILNDIMDYKIDKTSKVMSKRPLISGTISVNKAWFLSIISMIGSFIIAIYIGYRLQSYFPIVILLISAIFISIYDLISKRFPFMDIFVVLGIFFLILYGAISSVGDIFQITKLAWIVCILGSVQTLFMQIVAGGLKDVENDLLSGGKTGAIYLGVRIIDGKLFVPISFRSIAYGIQIFDLILVFLPFFIVWDLYNLSTLQYIQWAVIILIGCIMFLITYKILLNKKFERGRITSLIGSHYIVNFTIVPIMLMTLNPWAGLLLFFPGLGFIFSNLILHGTILQPKTM